MCVWAFWPSMIIAIIVQWWRLCGGARASMVRDAVYNRCHSPALTDPLSVQAVTRDRHSDPAARLG